MSELKNWSMIGRLLEEISWEGPNVRGYRLGGRGRENVLTAEVLMLLNYLPRTAFLGGVIEAAEGATAARGVLLRESESAQVTLLPEELRLRPARIVVQPDALIATDSVSVLVEAKRIRSSSFQPHQLAREYLAIVDEAEGRLPLLLLVLGAPPPVVVKQRGKLSICDAISGSLPDLLAKVDSLENFDELMEQLPDRVAWITWERIAEVVQNALEQVLELLSADLAVRRLAADLLRTIAWHA